MNLIAWILVGGLAGWIASLLTKTQDTGCFANIIIGMIGSIIGGLVVSLLSSGHLNFTFLFTGFDLISLLVSVLGAVLFLAILKGVRGDD